MPFLPSRRPYSATDAAHHNCFSRTLEYIDRLHLGKTVPAKILRTWNPAICSNRLVRFPQPSRKNHCISKRYWR